MSRASPSPEATRGQMPVFSPTRIRKSSPFRASRMAEVATARILSTRWLRRAACTCEHLQAARHGRGGERPREQGDGAQAHHLLLARHHLEAARGADLHDDQVDRVRAQVDGGDFHGSEGARARPPHCTRPGTGRDWRAPRARASFVALWDEPPLASDAPEPPTDRASPPPPRADAGRIQATCPRAWRATRKRSTRCGWRGGGCGWPSPCSPRGPRASGPSAPLRVLRELTRTAGASRDLDVCLELLSATPARARALPCAEARSAPAGGRVACAARRHAAGPRWPRPFWTSRSRACAATCASSWPGRRDGTFSGPGPRSAPRARRQGEALLAGFRGPRRPLRSRSPPRPAAAGPAAALHRRGHDVVLQRRALAGPAPSSSRCRSGSAASTTSTCSPAGSRRRLRAATRARPNRPEAEAAGALQAAFEGKARDLHRQLLEARPVRDRWRGPLLAMGRPAAASGVACRGKMTAGRRRDARVTIRRGERAPADRPPRDRPASGHSGRRPMPSGRSPREGDAVRERGARVWPAPCRAPTRCSRAPGSAPARPRRSSAAAYGRLEPEKTPALAGGSFEALAQRPAPAIPPRRRVALVGHEPWLSGPAGPASRSPRTGAARASGRAGWPSSIAAGRGSRTAAGLVCLPAAQAPAPLCGKRPPLRGSRTPAGRRRVARAAEQHRHREAAGDRQHHGPERTRHGEDAVQPPVEGRRGQARPSRPGRARAGRASPSRSRGER